jgi:hypothetical protein
MNHRSNWKECQSSVTTLFHFKWQQNVIGIDYPTLSQVNSIPQTVNHYEFHSQISNKYNLFVNLTKYCESKGLEVFKYIPFTVLLQYDTANYSSQVENFKLVHSNIKDYININKNQDFLASTSTKLKIKKYNSLFPFFGAGNEKLGLKTSVNIPKTYFSDKNFWIVKACDLNRGRCVKMAESFQDIQNLVKQFYDGIRKEFKSEEDIQKKPNLAAADEERKNKLFNQNNYRSNSVIVQKYLEKPLLYKGRKFDMRIWVLINHKFEVFVFKEGHLKCSSVPYNINLKDSYVHITNYSVQKYNENFSKYEYGNEVSFEDFQDFLTKEYPGTGNNFLRESIWMNIKEIIEISMRAVKNKINAHCRKNCFEIFGYDFILDEDFNVYLIEINTNPGLEESSPLIKELVPRMLDDALRITIDDIYETKYHFNLNDEIPTSENKEEPQKYISPFPVKGYKNSDIIWERVCNLNEKDPKENMATTQKIKKK